MAKEHLPEKKAHSIEDLNKFLETMVEWANYGGKRHFSMFVFHFERAHKKRDSWAVGFFPLEFLIIELFAYLVSFHLTKKKKKRLR